jgi:tRNA (cmo5U34)-methyltransferase
MSEFEFSRWARPEFAQNFMEAADHFMPLRPSMMATLGAFYRFFILPNAAAQRILELGSGHGAHAHALLKINPALEATLIDGSDTMLKSAQDRLAGFSGVRFIQSSFQELLECDPVKGRFHFILSSMAIHHLSLAEKHRLFKYIFKHLEAGGWFLNIDVTLAPDSRLEEWYLSLWADQIQELEKQTKPASTHLGVIQRYKESPDDKPDTLVDQLTALREAGFSGVDCIFKDGIFTMYAGQRK